MLGWFRRPAAFTPTERMVLSAVELRLPAEARSLFCRQLAEINRVQRAGDGREVRCYSMRSGRPHRDPALAFPFEGREEKLAEVLLAGPRPAARWRVSLWLVDGLLFSLEFDRSPGTIRDPDEVTVEGVLIHRRQGLDEDGWGGETP